MARKEYLKVAGIALLVLLLHEIMDIMALIIVSLLTGFRPYWGLLGTSLVILLLSLLASPLYIWSIVLTVIAIRKILIKSKTKAVILYILALLPSMIIYIMVFYTRYTYEFGNYTPMILSMLLGILAVLLVLLTSKILKRVQRHPVHMKVFTVLLMLLILLIIPTFTLVPSYHAIRSRSHVVVGSVTANGSDVYIAGYFEHPGDEEFKSYYPVGFIEKLNKNDSVWYKEFHHAMILKVRFLDSYIYGLGWNESTEKFFVIKLDPEGNIKWIEETAWSDYVDCLDPDLTSTINIDICGSVVYIAYPPKYSSRTYILALDAEKGSEIWMKTFNTTLTSLYVFDGILYASSNRGVFFAIDTADGKLLYEQTLREYFINNSLVYISDVYYTKILIKDGDLVVVIKRPSYYDYYAWPKLIYIDDFTENIVIIDGKRYFTPSWAETLPDHYGSIFLAATDEFVYVVYSYYASLFWYSFDGTYNGSRWLADLGLDYLKLGYVYGFKTLDISVAMDHIFIVGNFEIGRSYEFSYSDYEILGFVVVFDENARSGHSFVIDRSFDVSVYGLAGYWGFAFGWAFYPAILSVVSVFVGIVSLFILWWLLTRYVIGRWIVPLGVDTRERILEILESNRPTFLL